MSIFSHKIYARNYESLSLDEVYDDFLTINSKRFVEYIESFDTSCLSKTHAQSLEDWVKPTKHQTLFTNNGEHYFGKRLELLAVANYITKISILNFKYSQVNSKSLYCPFKASKNTLKFLNSIKNNRIKEMCIALYYGGSRWVDFLTEYSNS